MTYLWLSLAFLGVSVVLLAAAVRAAPNPRAVLTRWWRPVACAGGVLIILTAVFDNVMIHAGLMAYAQSTLSGLAVGLAPVEDFAYPIAGLILLPALWHLFGRRGKDDR
ncbi:lycopene cyclase domain-containing protein [Saxibacter everestensis]|uniref:Lycopene cyclase domain-containing protein n=1 Tax=Saxibacter everestensis TaxID=2909229 RepID=A0ABY8QT68_9MICO|nr:lycopene cyclase domain-containing protein [Brevibacteriaceae bacterium ZFBP1038]